MTRFFHDTADLHFRDPAGAIRAGSSVTLTLLASESYAPPVLFVRFDPEENPEQIHMVQIPAGRQDPEAPDTVLDTVLDAVSDTVSAGAVPEAAEAAGPQRESSAAPAQRESSPAPVHQPPADTARRWSLPDGYKIYTAEFTPYEKGLYWYWFEVPGRSLRVGRDPDTGHACLTNEPHCWQITVYEPAYASPDWIRGGVFYHVFVDRFAKCGAPVFMDGKITRRDWGSMPEYRPDAQGEILNNDFFGGNLAGIREKLPYLEDLGVTCIYLSPIFEAFSSHKYDTSDYMKVDPMFGDEEGFRCLCEEAGRRGIRIICDGVFSHTGSDSRYFDIHDRYGDGAYHHPDSPYRSWYYFEPDGYQTWWGFKTLPRINKDDPSYQEFITGPDGVVRKWLAAGASGWRLDVVDELPSSFLEKLTAGAKAEKPDAMILGEVWEDASHKIAYEERKNYFDGTKLDSVMNYPLRRAIIDYVRGGDARAVSHTMQRTMENYPLRVVHALMNILGTHDTDRIITALAGQRLGPDAGREEKASIHMDEDEWRIGIRRLKTAVVLQMTLPGVPCIYYGDEAGMEGYNDPFNRRCYPWGHENQEILEWYHRVIAIRRSHEVYVNGDYRLLAARDGLFAFERRRARQVQDTAGGAGCAAEPGGAGAGGDFQRAGVGGAGEDSRRPGADGDGCERLITAANCGTEPCILPLLGRWKDLLSGAVYHENVLVLPGQAMILAQD